MESCVYNTNGFCYLWNKECEYIGEEESCEGAEEG